MKWPLSSHYWECSRSTYYGIVAALPLLILYELLLMTGSGRLRNAGEVWIRTLLELIRIPPAWAGLAMLGVLVAWLLVLHRQSRVPLKGAYFLLMFGEALLFSFLVAPILNWVLRFIPGVLPAFFMITPTLLAEACLASFQMPFAWLGEVIPEQSFKSTLVDLSQPLQAQLQGIALSGPVEKFGLALGAGLFEEFLFRVILVSVLLFLFRWILPGWLAAISAIVLAAILFSLAHHITTPFQWDQFVFRFGGGLLFTMLYYWRGFAITAYTHALYDIQVIFF